MSTSVVKIPPPRLGSIDAYRGFVMFLMMAEVLRTWEVSRALPGSAIWQWIASAQTHVDWMGCSLHDLIQPSFSFLVGVALPFSIASRLARGQTKSNLMLHTLWRALCLVLLGVFLRSIGQPQTNWTFEDTLTQIGLGYPFLFILGFSTPRAQWIVFGIIVAGYWAAWALYPAVDTAPGAIAAGVSTEWPHHASGLAAHWNKNANIGAAFDRWFLNLFPRSEPFTANGGGYPTLNFIPTLGTMTLGLIAGSWLRNPLDDRSRVHRMAAAGAAGLLIGWSIDAIGLCPLVKRIWTPSWTVFSGGWCFLMLCAFFSIIDWRGWKAWSQPLQVVGTNSIAAYCIAHLFENFVAQTLTTHLGEPAFAIFGAAYVPFVRGLLILLIFWLILFWMFRRKIFLKI